MTHIHSAETASTKTAPADDCYHHGDLRRALIEAALALLTEKQDWDFSLRETARRAGVSHNAPYNHFSSKQELLAAVAAAGYDLLRACMQEAVAQADTSSAALKAAGVAYVCFGTAHPAHYRLMFGAVLTTAKGCLPPLMEESATATKNLLNDIIRQGAEKGEFALSPANKNGLDMAVLSAWSLVHGLTILLIDGLAEAETDALTAAGQMAEAATQILLEGISNG